MSSPLVRDLAALEAEEAARLSLFATPSRESTRRLQMPDEEAPSYRLAFQRDRDRVTHSRAFRRLKHKTQVFVPHVGDHPRTRLTHTLEVAQLARTIARALGLNEDLVEAAALGHDLGHTAFGHTGERVLDEILRGTSAEVCLPPEVTAEVGAFKHNYQSLRVVDLLERRYDHPGLNLSDQVREAILKHTSWSNDYPFPLPDRGGLELDRPVHLEGQVVAVADEIAQQTHDLEDGFRAGSANLAAALELGAARQAIGVDRGAGDGRSWRRQSRLIRGLIHYLVTDVIEATAGRLGDLLERREVRTHDQVRSLLGELERPTVWFSAAVEDQFVELKHFIYQVIINHWQVNRQDWRARKVITALFRAYWRNPLTLPSYALLRARDELGFPYLRDVPFHRVAGEIAARYHASAGFARLVADHIAGMSDRFALEEYQSLEQPDTEQRFLGDPG